MGPRNCSSVFVVGSPRSGTSVLGWALASLPEVFGGWELDLPEKLAVAIGQGQVVESCLSRPDLDFWRANIPSDKIFEAIGFGVDRLIRETTGCQCWVDTSPANAGGALCLANLFPRSLFIHIIRHPLNVVESALNSGFDFYGTKSVESACTMWLDHVRFAQGASSLLPDRFLTLRYSELASNPETVAKSMADFIGVDDWQPILDFIRNNRINSSFPKREGEASIGVEASKARIRLTAEDKTYINENCGPLAAALGLVCA
jgi:hypothetical protein